VHDLLFLIGIFLKVDYCGFQIFKISGNELRDIYTKSDNQVNKYINDQFNKCISKG